MGREERLGQPKGDLAGVVRVHHAATEEKVLEEARPGVTRFESVDRVVELELGSDWHRLPDAEEEICRVLPQDGSTRQNRRGSLVFTLERLSSQSVLSETYPLG